VLILILSKKKNNLSVESIENKNETEGDKQKKTKTIKKWVLEEQLKCSKGIVEILPTS